MTVFTICLSLDLTKLWREVSLSSMMSTGNFLNNMHPHQLGIFEHEGIYHLVNGDG